MISEDEKFIVQTNMRKYGGGFVKALAEALARASQENTQKIKNTWPEYWDQYLSWPGPQPPPILS